MTDAVEYPRVTLQDIKDNIVHIEYIKKVTYSGQILRWCLITLKNGWTAVGKESASVCAENDDPVRGEQIAYDNTIDTIWPLMGFSLKDKIHAQK